MPAPVLVLRTLWNVTEAEARRSSLYFVDRSLAQRDGENDNIRLHDLQLDYIYAQFPDKQALELIHGAVRLSEHVIVEDPTQFASQMIGRLLPHQHMREIIEFTRKAAEGTRGPWLRPVWPALHAPGSGVVRTLQPKRQAV
jgi:hypothetical protein